MPPLKVGGGSGCRVKQDAGRNGESGKARNVGQLRTSGAAMPSTRWWRDVAGKWFGPKKIVVSNYLSVAQTTVFKGEQTSADEAGTWAAARAVQGSDVDRFLGDKLDYPLVLSSAGY